MNDKEELSDLQAAVNDLISKGRPVFPLSGDKIPYANCRDCRGKTDAFHRSTCECLRTGGLCHGFYAATTEPEQFSVWMAEHPDCTLIAVPTGKVTGIFVYEYDPKNGGDVSHKKLMEEHGEFETEANRSPSGGVHYVFQMPHFDFGNIHGKLWAGIDIKATGGYHLVPPSHDGHGSYEVINDIEPQPAPQWLLDKIFDYQAKGKWNTEARILKREDAKDYDPEALSDGQKEHVQKTVDYWQGRIAYSIDGRQNILIYTGARTLFSLCHAGLLDEEDAQSYLEEACEAGRHPQHRSMLAIDSGRRAAEIDPDPLERALCNDINKIETFTKDDIGNVRRVAFWHGHELKYDIERGQFFIYQDGVWVEAGSDRLTNITTDVHGNIEDTELQFYDDMAIPDTEKDKKHPKTYKELFRNWSRSQRFSSKIKDTKAMLPGYKAFWCKTEEFDSDAYALNTPAGLIDLRTGEVSPASPDHMCTQITTVSPSQNAAPTEFLRFFSIVQPNPEHRTYIQRLMGATIIGEVRNQIFVLNKGAGGAGQGVFLEIVDKILGNYGTLGATRVFQKNGIKSKFDTADWAGKRWVYFDELGGGRIEEELLKQHTGGGKIEAEYKNKNPFKFQPRYSLWFRTNHIPTFTNNNSMKRRFHLVPWDVIVDGMTWDSFTSMDHALVPDYLVATEGPEILAWLLQGVRDVLEYGLHKPKDLEELATQTLEETDMEARFLAECTELDVDSDLMGDECSDVYIAYAEFVREELGARTVPKNRLNFNKHLDEKYGVRKTDSKTYKKSARWYGLHLRSGVIAVRGSH